MCSGKLSVLILKQFIIYNYNLWPTIFLNVINSIEHSLLENTTISRLVNSLLSIKPSASFFHMPVPEWSLPSKLLTNLNTNHITLIPAACSSQSIPQDTSTQVIPHEEYE
jgi:hypothetical protein